jgi:hypothetical protein
MVRGYEEVPQEEAAYATKFFTSADRYQHWKATRLLRTPGLVYLMLVLLIGLGIFELVHWKTNRFSDLLPHEILFPDGKTATILKQHSHSVISLLIFSYNLK